MILVAMSALSLVGGGLPSSERCAHLLEAAFEVAVNYKPDLRDQDRLTVGRIGGLVKWIEADELACIRPQQVRRETLPHGLLREAIELFEWKRFAGSIELPARTVVHHRDAAFVVQEVGLARAVEFED